MRFLFDLNQQVSGYTVVTSGIAFAAHGQLHAFGYTGGNLYFDYFFAIDDAFAAALLTFVLDDFAFSITLRTDSLCLHHAEDALLGAQDVSATLTRRTGLCPAVALGTCPVAMATGHIFLQLEFLGRTVGNVFQRELYLHAQVGATELALGL